jgi:hypothetical protein
MDLYHILTVGHQGKSKYRLNMKLLYFYVQKYPYFIHTKSIPFLVKISIQNPSVTLAFVWHLLSPDY